jgi:hypothetical protein
MYAIAVLTLLYSIQSCTKHEIIAPGKVVTGAKVAFVQASEKSAAVSFYAAGKKISSSSALAVGVFGGSNSKATRFPVSDYCSFPSGNTDFSTYIIGKVNVDSIQTSTVAAFPLADDKSYTYYYYDKPDGTQTAAIVEDVLPTLDLSQATVRFVSLVTNANDSIKLVVSSSTEIPTATVPYTLFDRQSFGTASATPYTYAFSGNTNSYTMTFEVWYSGPTQKKLVTKTSEVVQRGRTYTIVAFGSKNGTVGFLKFVNKAY